MKILLYTATTLIALVLVTLLLAPRFLLQERLRQLAEELAGEHAGVELQIAEPVTWRLLPRPSLLLEGVSLHLAHGATATGAPAPLLQAERLRVVLAAMPLLFGEVEAAKVELAGLVLHLLRNKEGFWNWQPVSSADALLDESSDLQQSAPSRNLDFGPLRGADLHITKGRVFIQDLSAGQTLDLRQLECRARLIVERLDQRLQARLEPFTLSARIRSSALPHAEPALLELEAAGFLAPEANHAGLEIRKAELMGLNLTGSLEVQQLSRNPSFAGEIQLNAPLQALARLQGAPQQAPPATLKLQCKLQGAATDLQIQDISLFLDDADKEQGADKTMELGGSARLKTLENRPPELQLQLQGRELDIQRLTALAAALKGQEPETASAFPPPEALLAWSQALHLDTKLGVDLLRTAGIQLHDLKLELTAKQGELRLTGPDGAARARLAQGELQASLRAWTAQSSAPPGQASLEAFASLQGAEAVHVLHAFVPQPVLEGALSAELSLSGAGASWPELGASLEGRLQLDVAEGEVPMLADDAPARRFKLLQGAFAIQGFEQPDQAGPLPENPS